ncbi:hypothetical protein [Herbaspirillum sp.]|uniref:hypothetical protein n=1 Tax=Herbaspirillum sp. TaxID=1890675 RepID=UPI000C0D6258|nr:hypothetical protein [Herbaspirillum sp.]MBO13870.1 hypothetical protein [Herbaspirillum sp.]
MASILLVLEVEGQARRYTSSAAPVTVDGATYAPGLSVDAVQVHALTTTSVTVDEPGEDWPALVLAMGTAPRWPAALYWADASGRVALQTGYATLGALGLPVTELPLTIDSATEPGATEVPDPATSTIDAGDWPVQAGPPGAYHQDESSIGAVYPRVYGAPGLGAMVADATGGPVTTAYRVEYGEGAPALSPAYIAVASPPTAATSVTLYDQSAGQNDDGTYTTGTVALTVVEDGRGRQVQVCTLAGTKNFGVSAGQRLGVSWLTSDPASERGAAYVFRDLLEASGRPVDAARLRLDGLLFDVGIESPVDPIGWLLEQTGGVPLFVGRSGAGFYAALVPIEQTQADVSVTLQAADSHSGIQPAEPGGVVSRVQVRYAPADGEMTRTVLLTATGEEDGATSSSACAVAEAGGYDALMSVELPAVCDPATAGRVAALLAAEYATPGPGVALTVSDPATVRRLLLLGPACVVYVADDGTLDAPSLTGRRIAIDAMTVSDTTLTLTGTVRA